MLISIVCYYLLFTESLAFNLSIYNSADYNKSIGAVPEHTVDTIYNFGFEKNNTLSLNMRLKNKAPDAVAVVYISYQKQNNSTVSIMNKTMTKCDDELEEDCLWVPLCIESSSKAKSINVGIRLEKEGGPCGTHMILTGSATLRDMTKKLTDRSLCSDQQGCTVVMDLQDVCQAQDTNQDLTETPSWLQSSQTYDKIWIYVATSFLMICVIILVIYASVIIFRRRKPDQGETMELNTYSTNEILYADLSFAKENSEPPKVVEESPYAEIIGVLKR